MKIKNPLTIEVYGNNRAKIKQMSAKSNSKRVINTAHVLLRVPPEKVAGGGGGQPRRTDNPTRRLQHFNLDRITMATIPR